MSTTHIRSLRIAQESSFGQLDTDTGLPDRTLLADDGDGLVFDVDLASITTWGAHPQQERADAVGGFHGVPPDPETVLDGNGAPVQRLTGELTLEVTVRSLGTADPADVAFLWALASGLTPLVYPTNASVTVETEVGAAQFGVADAIAAADLPTGGLVAHVPSGVGPAAFSQVVAKTSDAGETTVSLSPLLPTATLEVDDVVHTVATFGSLPGRALGPSVAFRADGHGWRAYAHGCRLSKLELKGDGRRLRASLTFTCAIIQTAHDEVDATAANVARAPATPTGSSVLQTLGAEVTLSDVVETAANAPRVGGRTVICPDEWGVTITNTLSPVTCWGSILGMTEMEATQRMVEVNLTLATPLAAIAGDYLNRRHRTLAMSWGPAPGAGLVIPAAYLTADPNLRELGGDRVRQVLAYREGLPLLTTPLESENANHLANSPMLLGFALSPSS